MIPQAIPISTFWQRAASTLPNLAKVALRLLRVNPTEASVERSFSAQGILHSDLRNRLSDESVESLMFVRMNVSLLRHIGPALGVVELD